MAFPKEDALRLIPPFPRRGFFFCPRRREHLVSPKVLAPFVRGLPQPPSASAPSRSGPLDLPFLGRPEKRNIVSPLFRHRSIKRGSGASFSEQFSSILPSLRWKRMIGVISFPSQSGATWERSLPPGGRCHRTVTKGARARSCTYLVRIPRTFLPIKIEFPRLKFMLLFLEPFFEKKGSKPPKKL